MKSGIKSGATGADVGELQAALTTAGEDIDANELSLQTFGSSTLAALHAFQAQQKLPVGDVVDAAAAAALEEVVNVPRGTVTGTFVNGDGEPIIGPKISLFGEVLRAETHLGDATTDAKGAYSIRYVRPSALNLLTRAYDAKGAVVATSATAFAAATPTTIDLTTAADGVIRSPSTYTTLSASVSAVLQRVALSDLKENSTAHEVQFVANASSASFASVAQLYLASVLATQTKLRADTLFAVFSQGIPAGLDTSLASLPTTGLDAAFAANVLAGVLAHSRSSLAAALTAAVTADVVSASYAQAQSAQLDRIDALRVTSTSAAPFGQTTTSLADLLAAGSVSAAATSAFTAAYAANGGSSSAALQTVQSNQAVSAADATTLANTLTLGVLLSGNVLLVRDSIQRLAQNTLGTISDLALLSASDWTARITAVDPQATSIPPVTTGETPAQKIARFSAQLATQLTASFPTMAFRAGLASAQSTAFATKTELVTLLTTNPTLDLLHVVIDQLVAAGKVTISAAALAELKTAQRLMRLTTSYANIDALKTAGFQSAQAIYFTGRAPFLAQMTNALGGADNAQLVYATAQMTYATALTTFMRFNRALTGTSFKSLPVPALSATNQTAQLPDVQTLFGSQSFFQCDECQSVLSPAAYLVDSLAYLGAIGATPVSSTFGSLTDARSALLYRRGDIQYIALDCNNTDTTIPYIDLVNEILEAFISPPSPAVTVIDTTGTSAERRAMPQSISLSTYASTLKAVFPFTLPFDLSFAQTTAYVAALGASRREVLERLHQAASAIAGAALGINSTMQMVINGTDSAHPWERWGFTTQTPGTVIDPANPSGTPLPAADWVAGLNHVTVLLQRADLTLPQLYQLLEATWVTQGGVTLQLGVDGSVVSASLELMTFTGLTAAVLDRAQQFLRLVTASGLQMWELDWALDQSSTIDEAFLETLTGAMAVAARLKLPIADVLNFWAPLETRDVTNHLGDEDTIVASTYTSVFANPVMLASPTVVFPASAAALPATLALTDPATANAIAAALAISADDIEAIVGAVPPGPTTHALDTLAVLFRYARLAHALSLPVADLLTWMQLAGKPPVAMLGASPADTHELLRRIDVLRGTGLSVADADYLLRGGSAAQSSLAFTSQQMSTLIQGIRDAIAKLTAAQQSAPDNATIATIVIAALATATGTTTNVIAPLYAVTTGAALTGPTATALAATLTASPPFDPAQFAIVFPQFAAALASIARSAALAATLHMTDLEIAYVVPNAKTFGWLDLSALPISTTSPYAAFESLLRALRLNRRQPARSPRLFDVLAAWQGTEAGALPTTVAAAIGGTTAGSTVIPPLATALGGSATDVTAIATALGATAPSLTAATQPGSLCDMAMLAAIADALDLATRYALSGAALVALASPTPDTTTVTAARSAFQAQYAQSTWLAAVQPVEDALRQTRRDALVAYLLGPGATLAAPIQFFTTDDIFDYFLIDPEMSACATTTRLLQASLSIQQFVQQAFLGLVFQSTVDTTNTSWSQWTWRQQYELWVANRQVFLYPENYLLPEARPNASPLFEDLESDLRQNNCDAALAQTAFENYLRGLVAASNLVVAAQYNETRSDGSVVLHVFAHTRGTPYQWSYRTRTKLNGSTIGTWTAWQELGLDIPSDQVVPVVWDHGLHLVWPIFSITSEKAQTQSVPTTSGSNPPQQPPQTYWAVQLAISELSAGQWQAKRVLDEKLFFVKSIPADEYAPDGAIDRPADAFTFRTTITPTDDLQISVYYNPASFEHASERLVATAILPSLESPLQVSQVAWVPGITYPLTPQPRTVDLSQEPTYALVTQKSAFSGSLLVPTGFGFSGQELARGTFDAPNVGTTSVNVLAPEYATGLASIEVLGQASNPHIVVPPQEAQFDSADPFFIIDSGGIAATPRPARTYLVDTAIAVSQITTVNGNNGNNGNGYGVLPANPEAMFVSVAPRPPTFTFTTFYHPFARTMLRMFEASGIAGLMARGLQTAPFTTRGWSFDFQSAFVPQPVVATPYPGQPNATDIGESGLDFTIGSGKPYSLYNWEVFYHAPMYVAELLNQNQQYSDAMTWLEYIFDPSDTSTQPVPQRFWETQPLFELTSTTWADQQIQNLLAAAAEGTADAATAASIIAYMNDPFNPHAIADLRITAYGKATVMKFLDNLIAWGDSLFTTYTAETVNQAEQLYIVADLILGEKPAAVRMPPQPPSTPVTYASIASLLLAGSFDDPLVAVENLVVAPTPTQSLVDGTSDTALPVFPETLLFCIPPNAKLLSYWDTVADRLYKIRHCLNLQGQAVPLPLYGPAINPLLAIQAAAGGQSTTATTQQPTLYRFATYLQRALDLTNDVRQYGSLILSALEKEDAEKLALLRATQEVDIQQRLLDVKTRQVTEANDQIIALQNQKAIAQIRYNFYSTIAFMNAWESTAMARDTLALEANAVAVLVEAIAGPAHMVPTAEVGVSGFGGTPTVNVTFGGENVGSSASAAASWLRSGANIVSETARIAATMGSYQRRADDWQLQANLAQAEMTQVDSQITAANDRLAIAQSELSIQNETIANTQAVQTFLTNKYTNAQLYDWMVTQLTTVFTQAYQLAYSLAQTAQMAYQFELGRTDTFLQINYWDAQHRGLTAGESLLFDLRRMESQYLQNNIRERELTKHISLANTQPLALITLLQTGTCSFSLDESLFDADHPGQFFRRLRDVAVTVPFIGGPYTGANGTLTLTSSVVRQTAPVAPYTPITAVSPPNDTTNFRVTTPTAKQSISISNGQHDSGLFEVNLRDERFLPFEAFGAISAWSFELNPADNAFDFSTITDVVVHVRYTAYAGGDESTVRKALPAARSIYVSTKATFSDAYFGFFHPATGATQQVLTLPFTAAQFPFSNLGAPALTNISIYVTLAAPPTSAVSLPATFGPSGGTQANISLAGSAASGISMLLATATATGAIPQTFALTVPTATIPTSLATNGVLDATKIEDVVLVVSYTT